VLYNFVQFLLSMQVNGPLEQIAGDLGFAGDKAREGLVSVLHVIFTFRCCRLLTHTHTYTHTHAHTHTLHTHNSHCVKLL